MDKYLKMFKPAMTKWLRDHYPLDEAKKRWKKTVYLDEKWIREEGDLGGKKNPMASNMLEAYAFFAFYEAVDRSFTADDLNSLIDAAMGKSIRMLSHFDMNRLLKHKWIIGAINWYLNSYKKKAEKYRGKEWGNTWVMRMNPDGHDKGIAFVYDTCPLNDFARRHGYLDFLPNLCYIDQITCSAASLFSDLSCVIVRVPSHFVSEGLTGSGKNKAPSGTSCWSFRGKELPYAPYRSRAFNILQMFMREKEMHIITFNRDKDITPETLIPIENIKAPVLMLSSTHDEVWPSYESASYMEKKLNEIGFPYPHKHIAYKHMSHAVLTRLPWIYKMAFKSERQHPKDCAKDREALKTELLDWVNNAWHF